MGWLTVILGGFVAGLIAKALVPGNEPAGFVASALIGIVGGIIGKGVMRVIGFIPQSHPHLWNLAVAVLGAVILLFIYHAVTGRKTAPPASES